MSKIIMFENIYSFLEYVKPKMVKVLGYGSEGVIYTDNISSYKIYIYQNPKSEQYRDYVNKIVTTDDIDLESFTFPQELYLVKDRLSGLKMPLFKNDVFHDAINNKDSEKLKNIDYDALINAYLMMLLDIEKLSKQHIKIHNLTGNLAFDGKKLIAYDTCSYAKNSGLKEEYLNSSNKYKLNRALQTIFNSLVSEYPSLLPYFGQTANYNIDMVKALKKVDTTIKH